MTSRITGRGWYILSTPSDVTFSGASILWDPSNVVTYYNNIYYLNDPIRNSVDISNGSWIVLNKNTNPTIYANRGYWVFVKSTEHVVCLDKSTDLNFANDANGNLKYVFNGHTTFTNNRKYGLFNNTYTIRNIPQTRPMAILNNNSLQTNYITYTGTTLINKFTDISSIWVHYNTSGQNYFFSDSRLNNTSMNLRLKQGKTYRFISADDLMNYKQHLQFIETNSIRVLTSIGSYFDVVVPSNIDKLTYISVQNPNDISGTIEVGNYPGDFKEENFYYGDITIDVSGDFDIVSIYDYYEGYRGGEDLFIYTDECNVLTPIITLYGSNPITLEKGISSYTEFGGESNRGENITITGEVLTDTVGTYNIEYVAENVNGFGYATRTVNVVDTTGPIITISGENPMRVEKDTSYNEPGAISPSIDLNGSIVITGTVDTSRVGTYTLEYRASDIQGNTSLNVRVVNVIDSIPPSFTISGDNPMIIEKDTSYNEPGTITTANDLSGIITASGTVDINTVGSYGITDTAQDLSGHVNTKTRTVNVLDRTAPIITISGPNPMEQEKGATYTAEGATTTETD